MQSFALSCLDSLKFVLSRMKFLNSLASQMRLAEPSVPVGHKPQQSQCDRVWHKLDRLVTILEVCPHGRHEQTQLKH